jgi:hypothetical protein
MKGGVTAEVALALAPDEKQVPAHGASGRSQSMQSEASLGRMV